MMFRAIVLMAVMCLAMGLDLTPDNFDEHVKGKNALVKFFAPWCGHCKRMAPAWDQLTEAVGDKVTIGKVDCTIHRDLCSRFAIRGFPTLKVFKAGEDEPSDYRGGRSYDDLKAQADSML
eukprot:TRINITY_DN1493_c0_g1_i4.p2 TRINITY_DN1493_c0_g1~~TRINITY_DN1493_c0_g1_i4.p2  ORF type:complete len:120 (+),score=62.51 TRINITY_DN1493_c0_g1_i4:55-414(+)